MLHCVVVVVLNRAGTRTMDENKPVRNCFAQICCSPCLIWSSESV